MNKESHAHTVHIGTYTLKKPTAHTLSLFILSEICYTNKHIHTHNESWDLMRADLTSTIYYFPVLRPNSNWTQLLINWLWYQLHKTHTHSHTIPASASGMHTHLHTEQLFTYRAHKETIRDVQIESLRWPRWLCCWWRSTGMLGGWRRLGRWDRG